MASPLLPIRHPKKDLFICDFDEVIPKSDIASMEHPLFTLSTKPDTTIRRYEHNGNSVQIIPSVLGLATIKDKDILIYALLGKQKKWHISVEKLHKKVGSTGSLKKFKESISHIVKFNHLPEYNISLERGTVIFHYHHYEDSTAVHENHHTLIKPETIEKARKILGRTFDVYAIEADWMHWWEQSGKPALQSPDGAFINFCKVRMEQA
jgi:hypothetical protein